MTKSYANNVDERTTANSIKGRDVPSANIHEEIRTLHPAIVRLMAAEFIVLLRELLGRDQAVLRACTRGDVDAVRRHIEKAMQAIQCAADNFMTDNTKRDWFDDRVGFLMIDAIEDAMRFARLGRRHWLTTLPIDKPEGLSATSPKDVPRRLIEARAAAILAIFKQSEGVQATAAKIAEVLNKSGFRTKRGPPTASTVRNWLKEIRACAPSSVSRKDKGQIQLARRQYFDRDLELLAGTSLAESLALLKKGCQRSRHRFVGEPMPTP